MPQIFPAVFASAFVLLSLFLPLHLDTHPTPKSPISLIAAGDVMLGRAINSMAVSRSDFEFPFVDTKDLLSSADLTLINLETPLSPNCTPTTSGMVFCADTRFVPALVSAGVDIVSLANNHAFDQDETVFASTSALLERAGLKTIYPGHPARVILKNTSVSFHAYNDIPGRIKKYSFVDQAQMSSEISTAKSGSDLVVVMFHWGNEYTEKITTRQKTLARLAIESGADLVIGSHPHWIQASEIYRGVTIDYSLGNYIFDQYWSEKTRLGHIAKYEFVQSKLVNSHYFPVYHQSNGHTISKSLQ